MTIASLIEDLIKAGTAPALVGRVVQAIAEAAVPPADEERATKGAMRTRRWRDRKASQNVTERHGDVTGDASPKASQSVTDRHEASQPRAHVRDISSNILDTGQVVVVIADAWPRGNATDHMALLVEEAASPRLDPNKTPTLVTSAGRLPAWKRDGASWQHDVVPTVTVLARQRGSPIRSWTYFDDAIAQSIANYRRALEIPEHATAPRNAKQSASDDNLARALAGFEAAARYSERG